ncbi:MAG: hypothetical protein PVSMB6_10730 [Steroidobacteraceae bacterium]
MPTGTLSLASYLSFFGGRRFVPIVSGLAGLVLALGFGTQWQHLEQGMDAVSHWVLNAGAFGLFAYGVLNRVLIVTGLHHIINNIAWFLLGDYHGVTGDLKRFFAGDPAAGAFMSGFFPVMMFGLPGACLAMYHSALPGRRRAVAGLLGSIALTSLLTGVTEPIEFTFIFLAPALYAVHAVLTGIAFVVMNALHVRLGFGFSAGLFDYVLNFSRATRPLWLVPVGSAYFALYYALFRFVIVRFDLQTPGRDPGQGAVAAAAPAAGTADRARQWLAALGGPANLQAVNACTTRLRLTVASQSAVDAAALTRLGSLGLVRPSANALQVVVGTVADQLAGEIRDAQRAASRSLAAPEGLAVQEAPGPDSRSPPQPPGPANISYSLPDIQALLAALGGRHNVLRAEAVAGRVRLGVADAAQVNPAALLELGMRGLAVPARGCVHLLTGTAMSAGIAASLAQAIA